MGKEWSLQCWRSFLHQMYYWKVQIFFSESDSTMFITLQSLILFASKEERFITFYSIWHHDNRFLQHNQPYMTLSVLNKGAPVDQNSQFFNVRYSLIPCSYKAFFLWTREANVGEEVFFFITRIKTLFLIINQSSFSDATFSIAAKRSFRGMVVL